MTGAVGLSCSPGSIFFASHAATAFGLAGLSRSEASPAAGNHEGLRMPAVANAATLTGPASASR
jgi:hypothetical protein